MQFLLFYNSPQPRRRGVYILTYYGHYFIFVECFCLRDGTLYPREIAHWYKCRGSNTIKGKALPSIISDGLLL